jgi:hypothetical protein
MAVGDIYNIVATGHMDLQLVINSYHYALNSGSAPVTLNALAADFASVVIQPVRAIQTTAMLWESVLVQDVDPTGLAFTLTFSPAEAGNVSDESLPPFACWSFLMVRHNRSTFNGHKRFAAIPETWQSEGVISAGHTTAIGNVQTALAASINAGSGTYIPVIYSTILNGVLRATPLVNLIDSAQFKGITSQNTRKFGRGS